MAEEFGNFIAKDDLACSRLSDSGKSAKEWGRRESLGRAKIGAGREKREKFPPIFFRVRAFSIPLARLSRSLEQAKDERLANSGDVKPLETIRIIFDETTYKDPAQKHRTSEDSDYASLGKMCLQIRFGSSYILYLTTYKMSDNIKEDILVTYDLLIPVIQC